MCPIAAVLAYLALRGQTEGPPFMWDGRSLSRETLVQWLRAKVGINPSRFSGHSFRIGTACTAAARGIGESAVQTRKSDAYKRYIHIPRQDLASISRSLAS